LGMVCEKRTYLKRLFCKADSKNIVLEAGGQEQGIRVSSKRTKSGIQKSRTISDFQLLAKYVCRG